MDDIDSILNDFDAAYNKANEEDAQRSGVQQPVPQEEEEDELAVMSFMTGQPTSKQSRQLSMESNDNLDEEVDSFIRKNSNTDGAVAAKLGVKSKNKSKNSKAKSVTLSEPVMREEEPTVEELEPMDEDVANDEEEMAEEEMAEEEMAEEEEEGGGETDDYGDDGEDDYADDAEEDEGQPEVDDEAQEKERPYQTDMSRPVVQFGKTKLTYGEAKLYGLLDENGEVKLKQNNDSFARSREAVLHSRAMAERKESAPRGPTEEEREMTFKPTRSKEANKAMMSRGCGYDFVGRLDEGGDFLQRAFAKGEKGKTEKRMLEAQKEDYEARLDRLKCPKCKKFQAFDEYIEKKRSCQQCRVRYVKSSVSHPKAYAQKQAEAERKKKERLKKIEDELYPPLPKPSGKVGGKSLIERTNELMAAQKEQARIEQEAKKRAEIEALAKARAPPRPVTQPVHVAVAEGKPPRPASSKLNATTGAKSTGMGKKKPSSAVKHSVISEKFNKLIQYPKEEAEVKS